MSRSLDAPQKSICVLRLVGSSASDWKTVGEFLRRKIERHPFPHREGQPMGHISVSGGVATYPEDGDTAAKLLTAADNRLYIAKNKGRNLVVAQS